jgi:gliding motility-associated-like protein
MTGFHKYIVLFVVLLLNSSLICGQNPPLPPEIEFVSIENNEGVVSIQWMEVQQLIDGYIIFEIDPVTGGAYPLDTIVGQENTAVMLTAQDVSTRPLKYSVASYYLDGDSLIDGIQSKAHETLYLQVKWDSCNKAFDLDWNEYSGWEDQSVEYTIQVKGESIASTEVPEYRIEELSYDEQYNVRIIGTNGEWNSESNRVKVKTAIDQGPDYIVPEYTNNEGAVIDMKFLLNGETTVRDYQIHKLDQKGEPVSSQTIEAISEELKYTDSFYEEGMVNTYQVVAMDHCGNPGTQSPLVQNMVLKASENGEAINLSWNHFQGWPDGVAYYKIYRDLGDGIRPIGETVQPEFVDNLSAIVFKGYKNRIKYRVEAISNTDDIYSRKFHSWSDEITVEVNPRVIVYEAFTPNADAVNDHFIPEFSFYPSYFKLIIYDRWGGQVAVCENVYEGWDGRDKNGSFAEAGVYTYILEYSGEGGGRIKKQGLVTVVYP